MKEILSAIAGLIFIICVPILLLTTNSWFTANDIRLYEYDYNHYPVGIGTGLDKEEFLDVADEIITYFKSDEEYLDVELFSEREVAHMKDVKGLIQLDYKLLLASLSFIVAYIVINFALRRGSFWRVLAKRLIQGSAVTVIVLAVLGLWALIDFDSLFLCFHKVSFTNNLWQLAPGDNLVLMFPEAFFNDAALFIAAVVLGETILIAILAGVFLAVLRWKQKGESVTTQSDWTREV
ncbi:MAG TPA: TIGR01906 family membrane protein [Dehalococcoidia bacterium]|nr:TIGR01906 family membrane protein [Dehalococcoidia bacterium]